MGSTRDDFGTFSPRRLLAAGCAILVFALGLFAASPVLHGHLHSADAPTIDDRCAVVLFALGVSVPVAEPAPAPVVTNGEPATGIATDDLLLDATHYRLLPGRGPPTVSF